MSTVDKGVWLIGLCLAVFGPGYLLYELVCNRTLVISIPLYMYPFIGALMMKAARLSSTHRGD